jgi:ribosome-binding factor A
MTQRTDRIDELLRQEIGQALEREVTDPRIGFVTVTKVETTPDLSYAKVWVSIIGTPDERKQTLTALRGAMPFVRHGLGKKLTLRRVPQLEVRLDETIERGTRVLQILNELSIGKASEPAAAPAVGESLPTPVPRLRHEGDAAEEPPPIADGPGIVADRKLARRRASSGSDGRGPSGHGPSGRSAGGRGSAERSGRKRRTK